MYRVGKRFGTWAATVVAALLISTCCNRFVMADERTPADAYPPFTFKFFEPNENCQYGKVDFVFKDGTAHVTLWGGAGSDGKQQYMSGKVGTDRKEMMFTYGRVGCRIAVSVYPVR